MKKNNVKIALLSIAILASIVLGLGFSTAWFTDLHLLNGSGTTPNVSIQLYSGSTSLDTVLTYDQVNNGDELASDINFKYAGTNINMLVRFRVEVDMFNNGTMIDDSTASTWYSLDVSSAWIYSDGWYYYNAVLSKSNASTAVYLLNGITITNANATGKDVQVYVIVEGVQANQTGINKFKGTNNEYTLPSSYQDGSILG